METLTARYGGSLALLTDLYQLTMAYGYWKAGVAEREAAFHLFFRKPPFGGAYAVACGLAEAIDYLTHFRFAPDDLDYLAGLKGSGGRPLFEPAFLDALGGMRLTVDVDAIPEGTVVFPPAPLLRVTGPLWQAQLLETALLTLLNFATLIATKAARVRQAAGDTTVLEFGLRRAQGPDGGITASRAAYVGGCDATSNVLAGKLYGIPVKGTHAHSWVMAFDSEQTAFDTYADALPHNAILLVDTYETLAGVDRAIETGRRLRERGETLAGVRLDSGDLHELAVAARRKLDAAGFAGTKIVASGDLDEYRVAELRAAGAPIDVWGVGTSLVTAADQPSLGGVYKLAAIKDADGTWRHRVKVSDDRAKSSMPGLQQVRRLYRGRTPVADVIYNAEREPHGFREIIPPAGEPIAVPEHDGRADLLVPVLRGGRSVSPPPTPEESRRFCLAQVAALPGGLRRLSKPDRYPIGLAPDLAHLRDELIADVVGRRDAGTGEAVERGQG
ncbi:MAG TPA: nicotinate phosphoribosyltransferase [Planctomycetaceae bacterium]